MRFSDNVFLILLTSSAYVYSYELPEGVQLFLDENGTTSEDTLKYIAVITRHGSRSPLHTYTNDPYPYYNTKYWSRGRGQLTNYGKEQMYHVGKVLRKRYYNFLGKKFYPNDTIVQYNPYDRDYDSAACLLAGLYPPLDTEVWNKNILWQPIPMSIRMFDICDIGLICPAYDNEVKRLLSEFDEKSGDHRDLLSLLSLATGTTITKLTELRDLFDILLMQRQNGFTLPTWTEDVFPDKMHHLFVESLIIEAAGSEKLIRLWAGPELNHILSFLVSNTVNLEETNNKMYILTGHDSTLIALLYALGHTDPNLDIQTGAYLVFELHYLPPNYFVKVMYFKTPLTNEPIDIVIKGCREFCPMDFFKSFVNQMNPKNWSEECNQIE